MNYRVIVLTNGIFQRVVARCATGRDAKRVSRALNASRNVRETDNMLTFDWEIS